MAKYMNPPIDVVEFTGHVPEWLVGDERVEAEALVAANDASDFVDLLQGIAVRVGSYQHLFTARRSEMSDLSGLRRWLEEVIEETFNHGFTDGYDYGRKA